jgi:DNA-binding MarR family transcriptional regulator
VQFLDETSVHHLLTLISTFLLKKHSQAYHMYVARAQGTSYETTILVRDSCLCLHVQRAARALARHFDTALRPLGLTNGQFSLLMSLNRPDAPTMGSVASLLAMDRTTLTASLKPLQRRGLIKVTTDHGDHRARLLELTPKGKRLLARAVPLWTSTHAAVEARLGLGEPDRLRKALHVLS